ncbi:E3 ubiquitin-protein ligase RFWD3 [Stomoxys calcitrans]|uniref:E3 ubiquitin-protein ligase RFWD3 n=1 Tax=Stomoxys calcitrans TaxID=35570 RepID=UPI0027E3B188|nr:E3 ubiquitin-protein ligase RFWD3 [Stomoxys calcitrans]
MSLFFENYDYDGYASSAGNGSGNELYDDLNSRWTSSVYSTSDSLTSATSSNSSSDTDISSGSGTESSSSSSSSISHDSEREDDDDTPMQSSSRDSSVANVSGQQHINITTALNPRKEKARLTLQARKNGEDDESSLSCSLCLLNCEMLGDHRLCSLKCGHFFGESCLRKRLKETPGSNVCPDCKAKARVRHIRYLYAKRLVAIDRTEEVRVRDQLNQERTRTQILQFELDSLKTSYLQVTQKMQSLAAANESLKEMLQHKGIPSTFNMKANEEMISTNPLTYKLILDKKIPISSKACCRVMKYDDRRSKLIISQKGFFPGYGLRIMNAPGFENSNYLYTSQKMVCDISLSPGNEQNLIAVASKERTSKLFDMRNFQAVTVFKPGKESIRSCAISCNESESKLYLGSTHGSVYLYDTRNPGTIVNEYNPEPDRIGAIIQIETVPKCELFPHGGLIVCKISSLWFLEPREENDCAVELTCLLSEANFVSINYNSQNRSLLVQADISADQPRVRHILGYLTRDKNNVPIYQTDVVFFALTSNPIATRSTQIQINSNTLVVAYMQDPKLLALYDKNSEQSIQSHPMSKVVYDACPIYTSEFTYLAALNKSKCFLYKVTSST